MKTPAEMLLAFRATFPEKESNGEKSAELLAETGRMTAMLTASEREQRRIENLAKARASRAKKTTQDK